MDNLHRFTAEVRNRLVAVLVIDNVFVIGDWWLAEHIFKLNGLELLASAVIVSLAAVTILPWLSSRYITQPTELIWQAILHIAPETADDVSAPDLEQTHLGRELVTNLVGHIYQLASVVDTVEKTAAGKAQDLHGSGVARLLPLPLIVLAKDQTITFANEPALNYLKLAEADVVGKNVYGVLDLAFQTDDTLDTWLAGIKNASVTATQTWERVRLRLTDADATVRLCDLAAHYSQDNPQGYETVLVLFDHTERYSQDDQAMSFVALAVHELRTPLTLLRGYIEAFEEELGGSLSGEPADFMHKMEASAQQLAAFVNNILNVARIEADQMTLQLHEARWSEIVQAAVHDMSLRAGVRGIAIKTELAPDLPPVAVDRVSIYEVLANLIDNAIKYSGTSKQILIKSYLAKDGLVETTVQDFGIGVTEAVMPHLFTKFYRDWRHRDQIGGTGLGLYLSKTIVSAHGGNIWVRSKEGEGAIFGFTVVPYTKLADELKNQDNSDIVHSAHGWIKNHSLYRR